MITFPWLRQIAAMLLLLAAAARVPAVTIAEQHFDDRVRVAGTELVLNGVGLRAVAWLEGYAAGLYLTEKASTPEAVLASRGPKRLRMKMMVEVEAKEFVKATNSGMKRNHTAAEHAALLERIQRFDANVAAVRLLKKGDVVDLDFIPGQGLHLIVNGKRRGEVLPGDDFYAGLLKIFVGNRPVDPELKTGLLGGA
jgi:hypothetical protein